MTPLLVMVFSSVFAVLALVMLAWGSEASQRAKLMREHLESALVSNMPRSSDILVDLRRNELFSAVPWINSRLSTVSLGPRLRILLQQAGLAWTAGRLLLMSTTLFVLSYCLIYLRTEAQLFALVMGVVFAYLPFAYVIQRRRQRFHAFEQGLPEALDLMVSALRTGHSLVAALRLVATESPDPIGMEFRLCFDEQNYGLELRVAMEHLVARVPLQDLRLVVTAVLIQKDSGGNLAEVLDKTAYVIRERFRLKRQVRVHTAQGRLTGWILSLLPVALGIGLYFLSPETVSVLWRRPIGIKLLYTAAGMTAVGSFIIRRIVSMKV